MKEKKEKVMVLVRADEESRRFLELAYNAAAASGGEFYILYVAKGANVLESGTDLYCLQEVVSYGCHLGAQVHICCDEDSETYIGQFIRAKGITQILLEPLRKSMRKNVWTEWVQRICALLPPGTALLTEAEAPQASLI